MKIEFETEDHYVWVTFMIALVIVGIGLIGSCSIKEQRLAYENKAKQERKQ